MDHGPRRRTHPAIAPGLTQRRIAETQKNTGFAQAGHNAPSPKPRAPSIRHVPKAKAQIAFEDILWLRKAATKSGADHVPPAIAEKLINAGLIEVTTKPPSLRITEKGRIALTKLG